MLPIARVYVCECVFVLDSGWHLPSPPGQASSWQDEIAHSSIHFITGPAEFKRGLSKSKLMSLHTPLAPAHPHTAGAEWLNLAWLGALRQKRLRE